MENIHRFDAYLHLKEAPDGCGGEGTEAGGVYQPGGGRNTKDKGAGA